MQLDTILDVNPDDFDKEILASDRPVLVDFWADWCQPCHMLAPTIDEIAAEYGDRIKVVKVDIDANRDAATRYEVNSIPTVMLFDGGEARARLVGVRPRDEYAAAIDALRPGHEEPRAVAS